MILQYPKQERVGCEGTGGGWKGQRGGVCGLSPPGLSFGLETSWVGVVLAPVEGGTLFGCCRVLQGVCCMGWGIARPLLWEEPARFWWRVKVGIGASEAELQLPTLAWAATHTEQREQSKEQSKKQ